VYNPYRLTKKTHERVKLGEVIMTQYTFYINGQYKTLKADTEEEAIRKAGIEEGDAYDLVETDTFDDKCLLSAITDDILFGS
jgi:hypothetical protein